MNNNYYAFMSNLDSKTMYALEYQSYDGSKTFDIFDTLKKVKIFAKHMRTLGYHYMPLFVFKADFNRARIYKENGVWNYDDRADTFNRNGTKILEYFFKF